MSLCLSIYRTRCPCNRYWHVRPYYISILSFIMATQHPSRCHDDVVQNVRFHLRYIAGFEIIWKSISHRSPLSPFDGPKQLPSQPQRPSLPFLRLKLHKYTSVTTKRQSSILRIRIGLRFIYKSGVYNNRRIINPPIQKEEGLVLKWIELWSNDPLRTDHYEDHRVSWRSFELLTYSFYTALTNNLGKPCAGIVV